MRLNQNIASKLRESGMRRKRLYILTLLFCVILIVVQLLPFTPNDKDVERAKKVVLRHTKEEMVDVKCYPSGRIMIRTGIVSGGLTGDGHDYWMRRIFGFWYIYRIEHWAI